MIESATTRADEPVATRARFEATETQALAIVACVAALALIAPIPFAQVTEAHEALEGLRIGSVLAAENTFYPGRPPLYYWIGAMIGALRGGVVDAVTLRLPSALLAFATVIAVARLGGRLVGTKAAHLAAIVLVTSPAFLQVGFSGRIDMALVLATSISLLALANACITEASTAPQRLLWRGLLVAGLVLGFLAKGPIALALPFLVAVAAAVAMRAWKPLALLAHWQVSLPVTLAIAVYYGAALAFVGSGFWDDQIVNANIGRFFGAHASMRSTYYLEHAKTDATLWTLLFPFALFAALRRGNPEVRGVALAWLVLLTFFQLCAYKRTRYLLPAQPIAALLVAWWVTDRVATIDGRRAIARGNTAWRCLRATVATVSTLVLAGLVLVGLGVSFPGLEAEASWLRQHPFAGAVLWATLTTLAALGLSAAKDGQWRHTLVATTCVLFVAHGVINPAWRAMKSWKGTSEADAKTILAALRPDEELRILRSMPSATLPTLFYLDRGGRHERSGFDPTARAAFVAPHSRAVRLAAAHPGWKATRIDRRAGPDGLALLTR